MELQHVPRWCCFFEQIWLESGGDSTSFGGNLNGHILILACQWRRVKELYVHHRSIQRIDVLAVGVCCWVTYDTIRRYTQPFSRSKVRSTESEMDITWTSTSHLIKFVHPSEYGTTFWWIYIYIYICIKLLSILGITPVVDNKGSRTVSSKAVSFVASSFNFKKKNTKTQQPGKPTWFPSLSLWVGEGENVDHFPIHVCRKCPPSARVPRCCWDLPMQQARIGWWKLWFQDGPKPRIRSTSSDG